jgi:protein TonB
MANTPGARTFGILLFGFGLVMAGLAIHNALTAPAFDAAEAPPAGNVAAPELPRIIVREMPTGAAAPSSVTVITRCAGGAAAAVPLGSPASWITSDDYPPKALRLGQEGRVGVAYVIGIEGRVADCRVTASSGSAVLDAASCDILFRRASYTPARDAAGCPIASRRALAIRWQIPKEPPSL